ncbi:MAG: hypothetical protein E6Q26_05830 [Acinetobacter sp.]|nr:NF038104 family lipoprotein [Acinetobacter sp.]MBP6352853.1 NF038104 family lipoprotein [Acinetobacter sp.]MBP7217936.1 NF038104 family lipoprotein [Acinetobacter sp.]TXJ02189.1 MAG: hypothetical protein E6Q26_05830 [Acinetobacter sp.]
MNSTMKLFVLLSCVILLQGCVHKLVTVPVKVAYKTTKGVVKGTAVVVGAVIPDGEEDAQNEDQDEQD